jgi:hypothetical protein
MSPSGTEVGQSHRPRKKTRYRWPGVARGMDATVYQREIGKYGCGTGVPRPTDERASPQTALRAIAAFSILSWLGVIAAVWGLCRLIGF